MEVLKDFLQLYSTSASITSLELCLKNKANPRIKFEGNKGSYAQTFLAAAKTKLDYAQVIIAEDKEEAAYIQNTLDSLVLDSPVLLLPDSFKRPGIFEEVDTNNILIRTESVNKISNNTRHKEILVSYPEALFEKVVDPRILEESKIIITSEEQLDPDTVIDVLVDYGFDRVDFVYGPGQFSIRGGIIDIFSYGNEWPYRIELFDDEVETIRTFNPTTQLSLRNIKSISIIPDINKQFDENQKVSIFDIFPEKTIIWIQNVELLLEKLTYCNEQIFEQTKHIDLKLADQNLVKILHEKSFIQAGDIIESLEPYPVILEKPGVIVQDFDAVIQVDISPQPSFNKNFSLLIEDMTKREADGYQHYIFTDNNRQIERFYNIFNDLEAKVSFQPIGKSIHQGFIDHGMKIICYTDHQIFERFHRYRLKQGFTKEKALSLKMLKELRPGDYVTHIDHGVGKYSGLEKIKVKDQIQETVRLVYQNNDLLYVGINSLHKISKYIGKEGTPPKLNKIGGEAWKKLKTRTKKKVKDIAQKLIMLYAKRKASEGFAFPPDGYLQNELEASFIYEDTPDQYKATVDVKADMQKAFPMDRLICGDVGFGKTEIAVRAAFKSVVAGKQVGVLVPTTILALQHAKTFGDRLKDFGVEVDYVNRFRTTKEKTAVFKRLEEGKIDILIGTHSILNKKVKFKDLGLLVIDEEQKFGVSAKEKLREMTVNVDTLTLTATPIPRTLQFSLMGARDLSIIQTPPPNRQPIHTERRIFNDDLIKESIYYETDRGGQVFFVHNRVKSLQDITDMIKRLCPEVIVTKAHGQMESKDLEKALLDFINKKSQVLVCTNIIETGLDIPNCNTIIINNAHHFGLSDLHQLRGRVGRSNAKAFCYLFAPPLSTLTTDARKRLKTLEEFSDLGSGFHIAMRDLDIRGAGNLLGGEQSGFISDIGYNTYQKILVEAMAELKEKNYQDLFKNDDEEHSFVRDVEIDADIEMMIPDDYVNNIQERLNLYTELDMLEKPEELDEFIKNLGDRFGKIPTTVKELFEGIRIRWIAKTLGFDRVSVKGNKFRAYFIGNHDSAYYNSDLFKKIMAFISTEGRLIDLSLKQTPKYLILIKDKVRSLKAARKVLEELKEKIQG